MLAGRLLQRHGAQRLSRAAFSSSNAGGAGKGEAAAKTAGRTARKRRARKATGSSAPWVVVGGLAVGGLGGATYMGLFDSDGKDSGELTTGPGGVHNPAKEGAGTFAGYVHKALDYFRGEEDAHESKMLPDYENSVFFQEGAPPPLTLVVDLEETLGTSTWDRRHGWRFVKRPGLDFFLHSMARCGYEVVVFSTNPSVGTVEDTLALLDPMGQVMPYKLYCNSAKFKDERYVKDLTNLNRDPARVVVVDDNLADVVTHKENCIQIKPFDDISVTDDDTLQRLGVFLKVLAGGYNQGAIKDVRTELKRFQPAALGDGEAAGEEQGPDFLDNFGEFLKKEQAHREQIRNRGLGGSLRKRNFLGDQEQLKAQASPQQQKPTIPSLPAGGVAIPGLPGMSVGQHNLQAKPAPAPPGKYRKTIWERMTDPSTMQKEEKELMNKEKQWQLYAKQSTARR
eukprot:INCI12237.1.p1 GENE.INCI12237.1~~INCI12237.1.p1  ORF type:complete len:453 (+),score=97.64 INCI12237.1:203-1561(+)